jgi:undecaprenyl-diphosphatase
MTFLQSIIIGAFQGITELFPVSSLGHSVILPPLLGWHINQADPIFLTFLVATHTATALVLFFFFWDDWMKILRGMWLSLRARTIDASDTNAGGPYAKLGWMLVVATVPAGILGLLFQDTLAKLFALPQLVAGVLILNGVMLLGADALRKRKITDETKEAGDIRIARRSWSQAVKVGLLQTLALVPGFSRTGSTITGGLLAGLSYEDAARFSFLLATPIIGAASLLKIPELFTTPGETAFLWPTLAGALAAAIFAYFSVRFLLKYFETKKLWPFAVYCIAIGIIAYFALSPFPWP